MERERHLTLVTPEIVGSAIIYPLEITNQTYRDTMMRDEEVEKAAMEHSMKFEKENGRDPEDVSSENLGFDIRSKDSNFRYIEVKGRAGIGSIALTPNEWIKAKRFGNDYWLYIVVMAKTKPALYTIQNPASFLKPNEEIEIVRYIIERAQWQKIAIEEKLKN